MSTTPPPPQLPPPPAWPPPSQSGWPSQPGPLPAPETDIDDRPNWRQGRPGWALLHLAIGVCIWFAGLFASAFILAAAGRNQEQLDTMGDSGEWSFVLFLAGSIVGWLLFAYLGGSSGRRWTAFASVTGGTWLIMMAVLLAQGG